MQPSSRILIIAVLSVLTMSTVPVLVKLSTANEVTIGLSRLAIACLLISPWVFGSLKKLTIKNWCQLFVIGSTFALHWLGYFMSIKLSTPTLAAMAISTYGVLYLALAWLFNKERIYLFDWVAVLLCFLGCIIATPDLSFSNTNTRGIAIGLLSALLYATLPLLHQRAKHIPTTTRTWGQFSFALLFFIPLWPLSDWQLSRDDIYLLLFLGIVSTVIAHSLWVKASTELPPLFTSLIYYLYIPLTMLQSFILVDETLTVKKITGVSLILIASVGILLYRGLKRK